MCFLCVGFRLSVAGGLCVVEGRGGVVSISCSMMWYFGDAGGALGFWGVSSFLICMSVGIVCSFDVRVPVVIGFAGFCVLGLVVLRFGAEFSDIRSIGRGG